MTQKTSPQNRQASHETQRINLSCWSDEEIVEAQNKLTGELATLVCCEALLQALQSKGLQSSLDIRLREVLTEYVSWVGATLKTSTCAHLKTLTRTSEPYALTLRVTAELDETDYGFAFEGDIEAKLRQ